MQKLVGKHRIHAEQYFRCYSWELKNVIAITKQTLLEHFHLAKVIGINLFKIIGPLLN